ncbi:TOBE domain-containing protein, partial [Streptomyces hundungensis]|uniref:TOBE domain-containing protein n=1 Tax=Streptomyces hundungensis TaxID=1077946 RepID=UPI0033FFED6F
HEARLGGVPAGPARRHDRIAVMDKARLQDCGTPQDLYRRPRTEFTASFVGNANLLPVRVGSGSVLFGDTELSVATDEAAWGSSATLCVRPHLVGLGAGPNALRGTVAEVQWRGSTHRLYVDVAGHRVKADVRELKVTPAIGDEVTLHFAREDAVLLAAGVSHG